MKFLKATNKENFLKQTEKKSTVDTEDNNKISERTSNRSFAKLKLMSSIFKVVKEKNVNLEFITK